MDEEMDRLQSIANKSNLVATVGEFIPKSHSEIPRDGFQQLDTLTHVAENNGDYVNMCNQNDGSLLGEPDGGEASTNINFSLPHSSRHQIGQVSSNPDRQQTYNRNAFFADNREPRFSKSRKSNNKWKSSESQNKWDRKYNLVESGEECESVAPPLHKFQNRQRPKHRYNDENHISGVKSFERNGTVYFRTENQNSGYPSYDNTSWRQRDGFYNLGHQSYFPRNNYKQQAAENNGLPYANGDVASGGYSYKYGNKYRSREYNSKNEMGTSGNAKGFSIKSKMENKENTELKGKASQREQLIELLTRGVLECLVCCELIYQNSSVWSCNNCYHVLHLKCIIKWAKSSKSDFGWRCPACQNVTTKVPYEYYCFCGKTRDPEWNHQDCPHSCGDICGKTRRKSCPHKCTLLCHPGPCPQCTATVTKKCGCQKTTQSVQCFNSEMIVCDNVCEKELNCLIHACSKKCHTEDCEECNEKVPQDCYCGKEHREVKCTVEAIGVVHFSCGQICQKTLSCGNHFCNLMCHEGECPQCEGVPELVKFCPCGKTSLDSLQTEERKSCLDPIPTCDSICGKTLNCGQPQSRHTCQSKCHEGPCPACSLETSMKCRCGHVDKTIPCADLNVGPVDVRCDKRCTKKRSCGKHKCNQLCCTGVDHVCPLPCNRLLLCGRHRCEETCHKGHCKLCLHASFEELSCECGAEVFYPPVPCGTRRPPCDMPCTRVHPCEHPPTHNCHSANQCPPCTVLTKKYCHGRHELRKAVPCHQESFSCGLPCGKEIECGRHKCVLPCHSGPCLKENQSCVQPCTVPRSLCGHICGAPCHDGPCPSDTLCKETVRVTCECGHRFTSRVCHDNVKEYQRIATAKLATKMADLQAGQTINLNEVVGAGKKLSYKTLECNDECKLIDRNRRLAIALQISNPDLSAKLTPRFSEYLKTWGKRDPRFCQMVHDKLTDLVQLAKQSKQKSRSYSFDPMNREKRHFIHEYCEHFGCESVAYDQEPKRNVVATAIKDKSWLPSMSIIEFLQKENSPRKVPVPVIAKSIPSTSQRTMEVLTSKILPNHQTEATEGASGTSNEPHIDYFDWQPQNS